MKSIGHMYLPGLDHKSSKQDHGLIFLAPLHEKTTQVTVEKRPEGFMVAFLLLYDRDISNILGDSRAG